jgi:hypothetical protein
MTDEETMTSQEVRKRIEDEIGEDWAASNAHGVDLRRCLVTPQKVIYQDSGHEGQAIELRLVLEEDRAGRRGYEIVYDENTEEFGLALHDDKGTGVFLGYYGTFLDTLYGM